MNWRTFRKAISGGLAAAVAAGASSLAAGKGWEDAALAAAIALVGGFGAVYLTPANERADPQATYLGAKR